MSKQCFYFESPFNTDGNQTMAKDTEKMKTPILPVPMTDKASKNLMNIQATRQLKSGKRTSLKKIATEIIEKAKD